ncbi:hypothetical protein L6452_14064 [Arctium lappa]|uniref:Uncharacterized protein n=1 Tax=Arctium lappa TaxID=4217 RepID=A0ACB9CK17_ARCLA|nr:hypothetical protein L6452_14064 [Arctium lappa]
MMKQIIMNIWKGMDFDDYIGDIRRMICGFKGFIESFLEVGLSMESGGNFLWKNRMYGNCKWDRLYNVDNWIARGSGCEWGVFRSMQPVYATWQVVTLCALWSHITMWADLIVNRLLSLCDDLGWTFDDLKNMNHSSWALIRIFLQSLVSLRLNEVSVNDANAAPPTTQFGAGSSAA